MSQKLASYDIMSQVSSTLSSLGQPEIQNIVQCLIGDSVAANLKLARNLNVPFV